MSESEVADVFGIELEPQSTPALNPAATPLPPAEASIPATKRSSQKQRKVTRRLSAAARANIAKIAKARWAKLKTRGLEGATSPQPLKRVAARASRRRGETPQPPRQPNALDK